MDGEKECKGCGKTFPLSNYFRDIGAPDGHKARCKPCYHARQLGYAQKRRLKNRLKAASYDAESRLETNTLALELLILAFQKGGGKPVSHPVQIDGAPFPLSKGVELFQGELGPVLVFQAPTQRIRKSLAIETIEIIAREMTLQKVSILLEGLPIPNSPRLREAIRALRWKHGIKTLE